MNRFHDNDHMTEAKAKELIDEITNRALREYREMETLAIQMKLDYLSNVARAVGDLDLANILRGAGLLELESLETIYQKLKDKGYHVAIQQPKPNVEMTEGGLKMGFNSKDLIVTIYKKVVEL